MRNILNAIPDQIKRLAIPVALVIVGFIVMRHFLVPADFGLYGRYRAGAVDETVSRVTKYAGHKACAECHDDIVAVKDKSYHRGLECEVCHGPGALHIKDSGGSRLSAPKDRGYCPLCHEYLPSRPTGFPQIVSESHNPLKPCVSCHNPHEPTPPSAPKECEACHAEIARSKARSRHGDLACTLCHKTAEKHKTDPRNNLPDKPTSRDFCGACHAEDAVASQEVPRVDMATHGEKYVCWQCHYPHLPER
ncbi:MAG: hypothetical protein A2W03_11750 [Candidatus Aminicenantes bacterium RBG_16_63_16]|nr:MAG: hypothetical protein A2W03_11750 [Candidatus Aminicenantes bacterium RBG_16_63_16]